VRVDGQVAKASRSIHPGEIVGIELIDRYIEIEILDVPTRTPARKERARYSRLIRQERRDPYADLEF